MVCIGNKVNTAFILDYLVNVSWAVEVTFNQTNLLNILH